MTVNSAPARTRRRKPLSANPGDPAFYRGDDYRIDESIGYLLKRLRSRMDRAIDAEMDALDLTNVQWGPLLLLHLGMGETAAELARIVCVDTGAMTRMLGRLEAKGLIRRTPCGRDARVVRLALTEEGRRLCEEIPYGLSRVLNSFLRGFNQTELDALKSMIRRMLANAKAG